MLSRTLCLSLCTLATIPLLGCTTGDSTETTSLEALPRGATTSPCAPGGDCRSASAVKNGDDAKTTGDRSRRADGAACAQPADCVSGYCDGSTCAPKTAHDGITNEGETDVDCGGPRFIKCVVDRSCVSASDCESAVCGASTKRCLAPRFDDNVKNGLETDVDCGGPALRACGVGQGCKKHSDCESEGCSFDGTCAVAPTCTQLEGGQSCGPNDVPGKQADCCSRASVGSYTVDTYLVTAGRMRAFLERLDGRVRDWASTLPATKWNQAWTAMLPNSIAGPPGDPNNANTQLGPFFGKRSCETGFHTGHTFWTPPTYGDVKDFPKDVLDRKALNCVPWWLLSALCVYDGGHLLTAAELTAAYTNDGTSAYPWGARGSYVTNAQTDYAVGLWGYATPNPPPNALVDGAGYWDAAFYVAPPGRRPKGYNATGHADLVGNLLEWVGDSERQFVWKGSFENHASEADMIDAPVDNDPFLVMRTPTTPWRWHELVAQAPDPDNQNGYYGIGGRCGY